MKALEVELLKDVAALLPKAIAVAEARIPAPYGKYVVALGEFLQPKLTDFVAAEIAKIPVVG